MTRREKAKGMRSKKLVEALLAVPLLIVCFAKIYSWYGVDDPHEGGVTHFMSTALYFSTITFATVGYGDVTPVGYSRLVASFEAITGIIITALVVANLVAWLQTDLEMEQYAAEREGAKRRRRHSEEIERNLREEWEKHFESATEQPEKRPDA
jgi:hypothetical protein